MPVADFATYWRMQDYAKKGRFPYPAIKVTSPTSVNASLQAFAEKKSDGIIQFSTGGAQFACRLPLKDGLMGANSIALHIHLVANQ